jgi:hypothetical protein
VLVNGDLNRNTGELFIGDDDDDDDVYLNKLQRKVLQNSLHEECRPANMA